MAFIDGLLLTAPRLIGVSKKSGIKVIEQFTKNGDRVLSSFKPNACEPYKQIVNFKDVVRRNVNQHTSSLHSLNITKRHTTINEIGKNPIDIRTSIEDWFYNGQPLKTETYNLRVQRGVPDKCLLSTRRHTETTPLSSDYALFEDFKLVKHGTLKSS